jgi:hypothetical protein
VASATGNNIPNTTQGIKKLTDYLVDIAKHCSRKNILEPKYNSEKLTKPKFW